MSDKIYLLYGFFSWLSFFFLTPLHSAKPSNLSSLYIILYCFLLLNQWNNLNRTLFLKKVWLRSKTGQNLHEKEKLIYIGSLCMCRGPTCLKFQIVMSACAQCNSSLVLKGLVWGSVWSFWNFATLSADCSRERKQRLLSQIILWEINSETLLLERKKCHYPKHIPILNLPLNQLASFMFFINQEQHQMNVLLCRHLCAFSFNLDFDHGYAWAN